METGQKALLPDNRRITVNRKQLVVIGCILLIVGAILAVGGLLLLKAGDLGFQEAGNKSNEELSAIVGSYETEEDNALLSLVDLFKSEDQRLAMARIKYRNVVFFTGIVATLFGFA